MSTVEIDRNRLVSIRGTLSALVAEIDATLAATGAPSRPERILVASPNAEEMNRWITANIEVLRPDGTDVRIERFALGVNSRDWVRGKVLDYVFILGEMPEQFRADALLCVRANPARIIHASRIDRLSPDWRTAG